MRGWKAAAAPAAPRGALISASRIRRGDMFRLLAEIAIACGWTDRDLFGVTCRIGRQVGLHGSMLLPPPLIVGTMQLVPTWLPAALGSASGGGRCRKHGQLVELCTNERAHATIARRGHQLR